MIAKFRDIAREMGWRNALLYGVHRGFARARLPVRIVKYDIVAQPVPDAPLLPARRGRAIDVRTVPPDDPILDAFPIDHTVREFRFRQNAVCFAALMGGAPIGCLWLCLNGYDEDEIRCRFEPSPKAATAWDFDVYLAPDHRGGLGFAKLWDGANEFLRARSIGWSISRISAFNPGSHAAHGRLGARRIGGVTALCAGPVQVTIASFAPRLHISLGRAGPRYRIPAPHN